MHDHFAFNSANDVLSLPSEVVMIFQIEQHFRAEICGDVFVNQRWSRPGATAHQLHPPPVFLPLARTEREPRQSEQLAWKLRTAPRESQLRVVVTDRRPRSEEHTSEL